MPTAVPSLSRLVLSLAVLGASLALAVTGAAASGVSATGGAQAAHVPVKRIQRALGLRPDGVLGPKTRRAIRRFQRSHGLKVDGVAGPVTLKALGLIGAPANRTLEAAPKGAPAVLAKIAQCESGGNLAAISRDGRYRGKYQFSRATWEALGGTGDPAAADEPTQDALALKLYQLRGTAPWPSCA